MNNHKDTVAMAHDIPQTRRTDYLTLSEINFGTLMANELGGLDAGFDRIKIPSAGSTVFEMPGERGESCTAKVFSAVILHHHPLFRYYKTKYTGGNNPPDCGSFDGIVGKGDPGGRCESCPHNRFGSADEGGGKACKNRRRIYVLREGEMFPLLLSLPTGSLKAFTKYLKHLLTQGKKSNAFVTRFSLKKATSDGGVTYAQAQFAIERPLSQEEQVVIEKLSGQVKAYCDRTTFDTGPDRGETRFGCMADPGHMAVPEIGESIETPYGDGLSEGDTRV